MYSDALDTFLCKPDCRSINVTAKMAMNQSVLTAIYLHFLHVHFNSVLLSGRGKKTAKFESTLQTLSEETLLDVKTSI